MKKIIIIIIVLIAVIIAILFYLRENKNETNNIIDKEKTEKLIKKGKQDTDEERKEKPTHKKINKELKEKDEKLKKENISEEKVTYNWTDLKIKPIETLEGIHYTISAFEVISNDLVIAGNYKRKNIVRFVSENKMSDVELEDTPLDLLYHSEKLYVLCYKHIYIIENKTVTSIISFNIPFITLYDKLIFFDGVFNILMSDGSAYQLIDKILIKTNSLMTKNDIEIWIKKTSANSFEIKSRPNNTDINRNRIYEEEIGSITLIGNSSEKYYCIVDIIENKKTVTIKRIISSNIDNFKEIKYTLPQQDYSYIKNDIKIHNNLLYSVSIYKDGLTLNSYKL